MGGNYPPGTSAGDPRAPWNQPEPDRCEECGGVYTEGGHEMVRDVDGRYECLNCGEMWEDGSDDDTCPNCGLDEVEPVFWPCDNSDMGMAEREEALESQAQEARFDALRDEGKL